nr:hypothetical protein [Tanacetum cinerariifolium]
MYKVDQKDEQCPKKVKVAASTKVSNDGFVKANVNGKASTSQPKEKKEPSAPQPSNKGKDVLNLQEINIFSLQNSFDALMEKDKNFELKNVFVKDNEKPMNGLVNGARKKVEAPLKKTPRKTGIWSCRKADSPKRNIAFFPEIKVHYFDRDDINERLCRICIELEYEHVVYEFDFAGMRLQHGRLNMHLKGRFDFRRTSLTGFPAQSVRSSDAYALDSPYLLVFNTETSQSKQH